MKKHTAIICAFILMSAAGFSQTTDETTASTTPKRRFSIGIFPQYLVLSGMRSDAEYEVIKNRLLVSVGLHYYYGDVTAYKNKSSNSTSNPSDKMDGNGYNFGMKYIFSPDYQDMRYYLGIDGFMNTYNFTVNINDFYSIQKYGQQYYTYGLTDVKVKAKQNGINYFFGVNTSFSNILVDTYVGIGYRFASADKKLTDNRDYSSVMWEYMYEGATLYAGIKIGYLIF